ncbi:quinone oxidoreductase [Teratosphaeriaceae sp. CCFEE 6253]|nr:quinone oxidoreductase [Teratosphaeriaceae sp. CCFEE 6253]
MVKARQWILANKATDLATTEGDKPTFKLTETELPDLKDDELLIKPAYLSNDPAQRGWISTEANPERLYVPPVKEGEPMRARGLAEVIESKSSKWQKSDWLFANSGWSEYAVIPASQAQPAPELEGGLSRTLYLGAFGMTALTAYFGLTEVVNTTKDDIVVISGAAGATGSMAVQIAKKLIGAKRVIGIAGSDSKCRWVEKLGADVCLNYKSSSFAEDLRKETPGPDGFANVYFDNVGGEILDLLLTRMARYGRVAACGAISNYNTTSDKATGLKNWFEVIQMRIQIKGFIVIDYLKDAPKALEIFKKMLKDGKLEIEGGEHVVDTKFEDIPKTWMMLFDGSNQGKLITALNAQQGHDRRPIGRRDMSRVLFYFLFPFVIWYGFKSIYTHKEQSEDLLDSMAIATTVLHPEASFATWLDHHQRRAKHVLVYLDDPDRSWSDFERLVGGRSYVTLLNGSQVEPEMSPESRIMLRQHENVKHAVTYLLDRDYTWLLHIDSDELLYEPGGAGLSSWSRQQSAGSVHFTNHEALPLSGITQNPFRECKYFRLNVDGGSQHFMAYGNGKSAVRLSHRVAASGPHAFTGYRGQLYRVPSDQAMILHYPTTTYESWVAKYRHYGDFGDDWYGDPQLPNQVQFMLRSRDVVQEAVRTGDWEKARAFWEERLLFNHGLEWLDEEVERGRIGRFEPLAGLDMT